MPYNIYMYYNAHYVEWRYKRNTLFAKVYFRYNTYTTRLIIVYELIYTKVLYEFIYIYIYISD